MPTADLIPINSKFSKLTILAILPSYKKKRRILCKCDCGNLTEVDWFNVKKTFTTSCGCYGKTYHITHGETKTRLHNIWSGIKARCNNPGASGYVNYGGRGITLCNEWLLFEDFKIWSENNGYKDNLTIERKNTNDNYYPGNCYWANMSIQASNKNKRNNTKFKYIGIDQLHYGRWRAVIQYQGKITLLGIFDTEEEAKIHRNQFIINHKLPHKVQ